MKRRMLGMFLCVAMVISALIGCNSNAGKGGTASSGSVQKSNESESNASNGEETGGKEIYMFISQPEYAEAINTLIDEYKKVEPDVTVRYETTQNDYPTLLKAKLNSGECPDIFSSTSGKEIEVYKEYSFDLADQPLAKVMLPAVAGSMKDAQGNGVYGLAIKGNYFGLIYNKKLLEQVGVSEAPKTLTELKTLVKKLKDAGIQPFTSGFGEWWVYKHVFQHFMAASGEDYQTLVGKLEKGETSLSSYPVLCDNFFSFVDLVKENGDPKVLETDLSAEESSFAAGNTAIMVGQGAWVEADIKKIDPDLQILFAGYPVDEDPKHCQVITGADQALRVYKDSKNLDATLKFLNWWYTSDYGKSWFTDIAGVVPPIETTKESDYEIIKQGSKLAKDDGSAPLGVIYSTDSFHTAFGEAMQSYVEGGSSKEETIKTIEEKWKDIDGTEN